MLCSSFNLKVLLLALDFSAVQASPSPGLLREKSTDVMGNNYIVVLHPTISRDHAVRHYHSVSGMMTRRSNHFQGITRQFRHMQDFAAYSIECDEITIQEVQKSPHVKYVARDAHVSGQAAVPHQDQDSLEPAEAQFLPDGHSLRDVQQSRNWGLGRLSSRQPGRPNYVFQKTPKTRAYVLDTGIRISHKEFGERAIWGANFVQNAANVDDNGHGTHIAGIIAGETIGVDSTTVPVAVKVLDANSTGTWSGVIAGVNWAVKDARDNKALHRSVLSISIGGPRFQPLDDALQAAIQSGITVVAAASNFGRDACDYTPARVPGVITVAAIDRADTRPSWSNYGPCVDLFAPGTEIVSAAKDSDTSYGVQSGTSMACPFVSGLVTYLMSREGVQGPASIVERIRALATKGAVVNSNGSPNLVAFNGNPAEQ
ncbi:putative alkaline protease 1 [Microdochium bolleyi]|uniref:Putative alkaline protease 1 n=1 Tax=Microdochium bolleyi TaxID=196109 RepID=A0A136JFZ9_9PEZI|nr:putative alkaline protease 1 [Microdochium bolleyi]